MSRIGKLPIAVVSGVKAKVADGRVAIEGPKGKHEVPVSVHLEVMVEGDVVRVTRRNESRQARSLHGLTRSLIANAVHGVSQGFEKSLVIEGIGYRAQVSGSTLTLQVGLSHPVEFSIPEGIEVKAAKPTQLRVSGSNKQLVGQVAADIRAVSPPEPYKGKGIRYTGEVVRRKAGKAAAGAGK